MLTCGLSLNTRLWAASIPFRSVHASIGARLILSPMLERDPTRCSSSPPPLTTRPRRGAHVVDPGLGVPKQGQPPRVFSRGSMGTGLASILQLPIRLCPSPSQLGQPVHSAPGQGPTDFTGTPWVAIIFQPNIRTGWTRDRNPASNDEGSNLVNLLYI